jgi:mRNA interferase RelE/StbE
MTTLPVHRLLLERMPEHDLRQLPAADFSRIIEKIQARAGDPRPPGCRKLTGSKTKWRIRVGAYRVVYEFDDTEQALIIMRCRRRRRAYRWQHLFHDRAAGSVFHGARLSRTNRKIPNQFCRKISDLRVNGEAWPDRDGEWVILPGDIGKATVTAKLLVRQA